METITDWPSLWKQLVELKQKIHQESIETPGDSDYWTDHARQYDARVRAKWEQPDSTRQFIPTLLEPGTSLIDIGAGTGSWSFLFSKLVRKVTAVEPSRAMRAVFLENIHSSGVSNIEILPQLWQECDPEPHDYVFCSHGMYGSADFPGFVQKMVDHCRKMCFLLIRAPSSDGLITEAFQLVWKQPHDSPNFTVAYNILLQMGIYANVLFEEEEPGRKYYVINDSLDDALLELKQKLGLFEDSAYDRDLQELLERRLVRENGRFCWPGTVRSALIYWRVN